MAQRNALIGYLHGRYLAIVSGVDTNELPTPATVWGAHNFLPRASQQNKDGSEIRVAAERVVGFLDSRARKEYEDAERSKHLSGPGADE